MKHLGYIIASFVILLNVQFVNAQGDVKIGTQVWTSKNLEVSTFRNGEAIPEAKSKEEWAKAGVNRQPAWCYYDNDPNNGKKYGKLYNWYAVNDSRGLAPKGYYIPSDAEWTVLTDFLGGDGKAGEKMKSKSGWKGKSNDGKKECPDCADWAESYRDKVPCHICKNARYVRVPEKTKTGGANSSGFNGLPGGFCRDNGGFEDIVEACYFWSSSFYDADESIWMRVLAFYKSEVVRNRVSEGYGMSVRCLKD